MIQLETGLRFVDVHYIKEYADQRGMNEEELLDILEQLTDMTKEFDSFDDWQEQKEKYLSLIHIYRKIISLW